MIDTNIVSSEGEAYNVREVPGANVDLANEAAQLILTELAGEAPDDVETLERIKQAMSERQTLVALDSNQKVVAAGAIRYGDDEGATIEDVVTAAPVRGSGIGAEVIKVLEIAAQRKGVNTVKLYPTLASEDFYQRLGYQEDDGMYVKKLAA